jgi:hypothetical protein
MGPPSEAGAQTNCGKTLAAREAKARRVPKEGRISAGAVSGPPPIAIDWRAALRAAVRSNGPGATIGRCETGFN